MSPRHCDTCRCSLAASIEKKYRDDGDALEYQGRWGFRLGDRVQMTAVGEAALLSRSMLPATRGMVLGALTWRMEAGGHRGAISVLRDGYASPFWSPLRYWRLLRRRRTVQHALERAQRQHGDVDPQLGPVSSLQTSQGPTAGSAEAHRRGIKPTDPLAAGWAPLQAT